MNPRQRDDIYILLTLSAGLAFFLIRAVWGLPA